MLWPHLTPSHPQYLFSDSSLPLCPSVAVCCAQIADCCCDAETIDSANDALLWSRLQHLRATPFFRTFKVNLASACAFWADEGQCALRGCAVCGECGPDEIQSIWGADAAASASATSSPSTQPNSTSSSPSSPSPSLSVDASTSFSFPSPFLPSSSSSPLSSRVQLGRLGVHFAEWEDDDECLWIRQDTDSAVSPISYINLQLNPESYTGYGGDSAHEVWKAIYSENCFSGGRMDDLCYEQRVFYRLLSGMHAAISAHISNQYPVAPDIDVHADINEHPELYGPNLDVSASHNAHTHTPDTAERTRPPYAPSIVSHSACLSPMLYCRFDSKLGQHPERLNSLYFAFVFLLRAVNKASPMLLSFNYSTGNALTDQSTQDAVTSLLTTGLIPSCSPSTSFDETAMFTAFDKLPLKAQFKAHFRNMSRIMDCVGCEKCRLHGKLQLLGLGTALKVLFNDGPFELQRNEVVGLVGTLAKFSHALMIAKQMEERRSGRRWKMWGGGLASGVGLGVGALWLWSKRRHRDGDKVKQQP